jgi:chemotaxis protein MotB
MARKKKKPDEDSGPDVGMVMTVSLFLILLTFFILLNSIAVLDENRTRLSIGSLLGAFGSLPGGLSPFKTGDSIMPPSAPLDKGELNINQLMAILDQSVAGEIKIQKNDDSERVTLNARILFQGETLKLNPTIQPFLERLSEIIKEGDYPVEIVGHTDNASYRERGYESDWEHASLMALQVLKHFISKGGISEKRLSAYGYGSWHPLDSHETRLSRAKNRRVDVILKFKSKPYLKRIFRKRPTGFFTYKKFDFKIF